MKLFFILLIIFIVGLYFLGPILLIPVALYLAVGLAIFAIGTWSTFTGKKSIIRQCERKFALKDEDIKVKILASARGVSPVTEKSEPWNIVLVMDNSTSMIGTPLGNAKIAARNLVSTTPPDFCFALVEFQEHAHIRSSLTTNKMKLKTFISLLVSEGDTAIHEGLRLAYQVLKEELTPGKKNAVILLSDGFSDPGPALEQAENLKNQGAVIYSVALGHCDQELMRKIATGEATYFHTQESEGLKELYYNIGNIISSARAREVEITEQPNIKKGHFHIVQWGEIEPSLFDFNGSGGSGGKGMSVHWYLPVLETNDFSLEYYIRPRCYGWYRVSAARARLKLKDRQGNTRTFSSNKRPYILIIPRFFLWQIFWIFLNPLFWIIFRNLRCKGEDLIGFPTYEIPKRVPLTQPDILPTLETGFKLSVSPTLALGVGYGGINALTHFKRLLWEHNEDQEIKKKVTFCALDTVKPWLSDTVKIGHISLGREEKINIHAPVSSFIKQEAEKKEPGPDYAWLNAREKLSEAIDYDIGFGTNLDRSIGRLMVLEQRDKLQESHDALNIKTMLRDLYEKNKGENLQVCIAASLNGGTSSGVILDLCYSLKRVLEELNIVGVGINLFLMDYQVETDDPQRDVKKDVVRLNKAGFLNELARFFAARDEDFSPLPNDKPDRRWFDRVVWIDKKYDTTNLADLYPQCGILMYHWAVEKHFRDLLLDHTQHIHTGLLVHKFETDVVFFFKRTLEQYFSVRLLLTTLGSLLLGLPENPADYSVNSVILEEKYIDAAFELLYKNPAWRNAMPALLRSKELALTPKPGILSLFIKHAGMTGLVESSSQNRINSYLDLEENTFGNLLARWLEAILGTYQDKEASTTAFKERKLPTAYFALRRLKENF
ncbi:MAG: VWA domain-containing protein, partial [Candidatus Aminicenantes bacterium]